jgi:hypothetical protein
VEFDHSGIYTGMVPGMAFPGMGRNRIPLEFRSNSVCLFVTHSLFICTNDVYLATKHGHSLLPTHHQPCSSPPPPFATAHDGLNISSSPSPMAATRRPRPRLPQQEQCGSATSLGERAPATSTQQRGGGFQVPRR